MTTFKGTSDVTLPKIKQHITEEAAYWQHALEPSKVVKEKGIIDKLDLNSTNNDLLITARDRISIYNVNSMELKRTYQSVSSKKVDTLHWASYRKGDCKLFTSSTDQGRVNIFDIDNSKPIRMLGLNSPDAHTNSVRKSEFISHNQVVSFSDDKHIKIWDIADGSMVQEIGLETTRNNTPHQDYIRAGCVFDQGSLLIASGSYDHTVKLWDVRENSDKPTNQFNLNNPVESVITRGTFIIASASKSVKVIDLVAGKVVKTFPTLHSKTITTLCSYNDFWFTGSLDGVVKIFDTHFTLVTSLSFVPSQLLSIAVNSKAFTVGATDGTVISSHFKSEGNDEKIKELPNHSTTLFDDIKIHREFARNELAAKKKKILTNLRVHFNILKSKIPLHLTSVPISILFEKGILHDDAPETFYIETISAIDGALQSTVRECDQDKIKPKFDDISAISAGPVSNGDNLDYSTKIIAEILTIRNLSIQKLKEKKETYIDQTKNHFNEMRKKSPNLEKEYTAYRDAGNLENFFDSLNCLKIEEFEEKEKKMKEREKERKRERK